MSIRPCGPGDSGAILRIVNEAAEAYRGAIPADCWHEPYMPAAELSAEMAAGVSFVGFEADGELVGVMGVQRRPNVDLVRHAYVLSAWQGRGVGTALMRHLLAGAERQILVGTWADARWAIAFYQRHGFSLVSETAADRLLQTYWSISSRQRETSVVLAAPPVSDEAASRLVEGSRGRAARVIVTAPLGSEPGMRGGGRSEQRHRGLSRDHPPTLVPPTSVPRTCQVRSWR